MNTTTYIPAAATDIAAAWRRRGWVPPSELPEYRMKWERFRAESNVITVPAIGIDLQRIYSSEKHLKFI